MSGTKRHPSGLAECDWCHQPARRTVYASDETQAELCHDCCREWHRRAGITYAPPVDTRAQRIARLARDIIGRNPGVRRTLKADPSGMSGMDAALHSFETAEAWIDEADRRVAKLAEVKS